MRRWLLAGLIALCAVALVGVGVWLGRNVGRGAVASPPLQAGRNAARTAASPGAGSRLQDMLSNTDGGGDDPEDPPGPRRGSRGAFRAASVWTVDKAASRLSFRGSMNGVAFDGVFRIWDAQIAFDPRNLAGSHATFTVDTTSALTGEPIKDQALPNTEWLDTSAFPQATLVTRTIRQTAPGRYEAAAEVRIRGIAWRTSVPFTVQISRDEGRMDATLSVDRRTFGIGEGPFRSPAPVEPTVQVAMKLLAKKAR